MKGVIKPGYFTVLNLRNRSLAAGVAGAVVSLLLQRASMSVSIKVAIRCRPFTIDDDLGVTLSQRGEEEGEASKLSTA